MYLQTTAAFFDMPGPRTVSMPQLELEQLISCDDGHGDESDIADIVEYKMDHQEGL